MFQSLRYLRYLVLLLALPLGGCGMFDWMSSEDEATKPMKLGDFDAEVRLRRQWSVNVGSGEGKEYNRLDPVVAGARVYAAGNNGLVLAVNRETGRVEWRQRLDYTLTGGVGVGGGLVLVGTVNARVIALDAQSGEVRWESAVSSEVLSAPASDGRMVVVQTVDGKLIGLDAQTGAQRWTYETQVPALSLRGTSAPLIVQNYVVAALAGGTVVSVALDNGTLRWEERVAIPTGRSEIDRMVDIDGSLTLTNDNLLLAPSYQGYLSAIDPVTGQTRWRVKESSYNGASSGFGNVYITSEGDIVKAYRVGQDATVWSNDQMQRRRLSAPLGFSNYVAVGDADGYVHLLSQSDGRFVGRVKVDGDGIRADLHAQGNTLYVFGNSGTLAAYQVE
ncbi:MAG: outer membrane protein assembly factor BamB [Burkholderiaceae bacterium]|jgi:outer membrane protein assembly factor BamB|nr:outer membrane protein assembly factor BamB [Burkholderiaceae bacterium]